MTSKALKPGAEVDSWCTKCRLDLLHRVIAMRGDKIEKVECRTCGGHHKYYRPHHLPPEAKAGRATRATAASSPRASSRPPAGARALAAAQAERIRVNGWEKNVAGRPITSFKAYRPTTKFQAGDLIRHAKFGDGYITQVIDRGKVEAMFKDGPKTLAHALEL
jgi:hypothetical protein